MGLKVTEHCGSSKVRNPCGDSSQAAYRYEVCMLHRCCPVLVCYFSLLACLCTFTALYSKPLINMQGGLQLGATSQATGGLKLGLGLGQTSGEMLFCLIIAACVEFLPRSLTHHLHPFVVTCDFRYVAICVCVSHKYFFLSLFMYICIHVHADKLCV